MKTIEYIVLLNLFLWAASKEFRTHYSTYAVPILKSKRGKKMAQKYVIKGQKKGKVFEHLSKIVQNSKMFRKRAGDCVQCNKLLE